MSQAPARGLRGLMLATDLGFIAYWLITAAHLLPPEWLFKDYENPILSAWNWSFLPLDLLISATGITALWRWRREDPSAPRWALLSLSFTSCSGLMALAFWTLRSDFDPAWWVPNGFLLLYPLFFLPRLLRASP